MEQLVKGPSGATLTAEDWLALDRADRAIALEYPLGPRIRNLENSSGGQRLHRYFDRYRSEIDVVARQIAALEPFFAGIPFDLDPSELKPFWNNGWFPPLDGIVLCALLELVRPRRYVEIGSGNSTKFARAVIEHLGLDTQIISIDPYPRAEIDRICDTVVREQLENVEPDFFDSLTERDLFFIDSSHRSFQNSDVTVFFLEILPALPAGITYGVHDIFLPYDYPQSFVPRFYNEQYLLASYLLGGMHDTVRFPCYHVARHAEQAAPFRALGERLGLGESVLGGGAFWARKSPARD